MSRFTSRYSPVVWHTRVMAGARAGSSPVVRNTTVPLTEDDIHELQNVVTLPSALEILYRSAPGSFLVSNVTESGVLHALVRVGLESVARQALNEVGYRRLADDPEYQKNTIARRENRHRQRRPRHADDA